MKSIASCVQYLISFHDNLHMKNLYELPELGRRSLKNYKNNSTDKGKLK